MSETDPAGSAALRRYFAAIEAEFIRRRGTPFLLSAKDFAVMRRWAALRIELEDVLAGVAEAFERRAARGATGKINSLAYCEGAVLEAWERRSAARTGKRGHPAPAQTVPPEEILDGIRGALLSLEKRDPRLAPAVHRVRTSLEKLKPEGQSPEQIDERLARIEKRFYDEVLEVLTPPEQDRIEDEIVRLLAGGHAGMELAASKRTESVLRRRKLREGLDLPRFTLLTF